MGVDRVRTPVDEDLLVGFANSSKERSWQEYSGIRRASTPKWQRPFGVRTIESVVDYKKET